MIKIVLTLLLAAFAGNTLAANINIGPNGCTLADAIKSANTNSSHGNCASGSGTDYIIAPDGWVVTLSSDLPTIISNMTIRSASSAGIFTIDGNHQRRMLKITGGLTNVTLRRVKIRNGWTDPSHFESGAGILINNATVRLENSSVVANDQGGYQANGALSVNQGDLIIDQSTVEGNVNGSSIYAENSSVHIVDSVIRQNFAGIWLADHSDLTIENSLFDQSRTALFSDKSTVTIVNSTFTSSTPFLDTAMLDVRDSADLSFKHVTITEMTRFSASHFIHISNSLMADCQLSNGSRILLNTGNLYQSTQGGSQNCLGGFPYNYSLLPLADNGGPTRTRALGDPNAAAIGGGDPAYCEAVDQRGVARAAICDVGAYEATGPADVAISASIVPDAPYVSDQNVVVLVEIVNSGPTEATNVDLDIDAEHAVVTGTQSSFCTAIPCVIPGIQPGQTIEVPVEMTLASYLDSPFSINVSAHSTAHSTYYDANEDNPSGNNYTSLSYIILQGADLALTMDLTTPGPYHVGQTINYEARIDNAGPQTANDVKFQFAAANLGNGVYSGCTSTSGALCNVSNIASGGSRTIGIQGEITGNVFNAFGSVSATQLDINPDNNIDTQGNGGGVTDSDIAITARLLTPGPYHSRDYLQYEITITSGNDQASNIELDYDFPGAEFTNMQPCVGAPCVIPQLAANSEIKVYATFLAPIAEDGTQSYMNLHLLATPAQWDPDLSDNETHVQNKLSPKADVVVKLTLLDTPPFYVGQSIQYTLQVANHGYNAATETQVIMKPENLTLLDAFGGEFCKTVNCVISQLDAYHQENLTLVYRIDNTGTFDLTAQVEAKEFDDKPGNNTDSSNNGGTAIEPPTGDRIFADDFE